MDYERLTRTGAGQKKSFAESFQSAPGCVAALDRAGVELTVRSRQWLPVEQFE